MTKTSLSWIYILFRFYQLNDGNITLAQDDAETYITLAANEVCYHKVNSR